MIFFKGMVKKLTGDYKVKFHPDGPGTEKELIIDFSPPFKRVSMLKGLEERLKIKIPSNLESQEANDFLNKLCDEHKVACPAPRSTARLIDKVRTIIRFSSLKGF